MTGGGLSERWDVKLAKIIDKVGCIVLFRRDIRPGHPREFPLASNKLWVLKLPTKHSVSLILPHPHPASA